VAARELRLVGLHSPLRPRWPVAFSLPRAVLRGATVAESRSRFDHAAIARRGGAQGAEAGGIAFHSFRPQSSPLVMGRTIYVGRRDAASSLPVSRRARNAGSSERKRVFAGVANADLPSIAPRRPKPEVCSNETRCSVPVS